MYTIQRTEQLTIDSWLLQWGKDMSGMDWDKEVKLEKCEDMITVYEKHIEELEKENKELKVQVDFLKEQLYYKSYGLPNGDTK
mgnify:CR=1 FL=1